MALVSLPRGLYMPPRFDVGYGVSTSGTLDATGERYAMIGRLHLNGRGTNKTLSTGTIQFRTGAVTFANGSTSLDIGLQGVGSSGPLAQPDGSYTVKTTLTGGAGLSANAWNTATMNSGTVTLSHGDLVSVVWDMTARGGADSVTITPTTEGIGSTTTFPTTNAYISSAWQTTLTAGAARSPNVVIVFDDGTVGTIDGSYPISATTTDLFSDSTNPDERGMKFQVPFDCKVDALWAWCAITDANSDFSIKLYSDPTGSPAALATVTHLAERMASSTALPTLFTLSSEISLSKNTDYGVTLLATGSTQARLFNLTLGNEAHRVLYPFGTTQAKITRDGSSGAFTAENPAVTIYQMGVRISQFHDGAGGGNLVIGG